MHTHLCRSIELECPITIHSSHKHAGATECVWLGKIAFTRTHTRYTHTHTPSGAVCPRVQTQSERNCSHLHCTTHTDTIEMRMPTSHRETCARARTKGEAFNVCMRCACVSQTQNPPTSAYMFGMDRSPPTHSQGYAHGGMTRPRDDGRDARRGAWD